MLICLYPPYYARCAQFFPFQHLQLSGLLQFEEGGINAEFVGAAVLENGIDGGAFLVLLEVMEDAEGVEVFVVGVHISYISNEPNIPYLYACVSYRRTNPIC